MAIETTDLGFQKPDGNEPVRGGDNVIAANAQKAEELHRNSRDRLAAVEAAGAQQEGKSIAQDARLLTTETDIKNLKATDTVTNGRLAQVENAAGFGGDPLALNNAVIAAAVAATGATKNALAAEYALKPGNGNRSVGKDELVLNALDHGILGNGTNEGAAINAFLALAAGKIAYFPPGIYASSIVLTPKSNTTVYGVRGATIFRMIGNNTNQNVRINIDHADNVTLRDFTVTETNVSRRIGNYGLLSGDTMKRCLIENVECTVSSGTGMHFMFAEELIVNGCYVHDTQADGIHVQRGSKTITLTNNIIRDNGDDAIGFVTHAQATTGYCQDIVITGNTLGPTTPGLPGSGVALIGCFGATVVGNTIRGTAAAGIRITSIDETATSEGFAVVGNILVEGNRITDAGAYSGALGGQTRDGVAIYNARNVAVMGNVIDRPNQTGVTVSQCSIDVTIEGNEIRRTGATGIFVAQAEKNGNYLQLWTEWLVSDGRSKSYVGHHGLTISRNRVTSPGQSGISVGGSASRYIDGATIYRNKIRNPNTSDAAGQYGVNAVYINGLDLSQNDVGDPHGGTGFSRYNKSNNLNPTITGNLPGASTTAQVTFIGQNQHTSGAVDPGSGTWELGQASWSSNPQTGTPAFKVCATAGTQGTLNGGATTGSITSGSVTLTVSTATGLGSGGYITIAGVSGKKKIVDIVGTTMTLDSAADATVSGAAVAFSPASFRTPGNLA